MNDGLKSKIIAAGQAHLLRYLEELTPEEERSFVEQLEAVDWEQIPQLAKDYVMTRPEITIPEDLSPARFFPLIPGDDRSAEL